MPFRRLQLQLQQADWFAAAVNLVGVLLGVLLAFQIERWNEERRERRLERAFLERLYDESQANLRSAERLRVENADTVTKLLNIHRAMPEPAALAELEQTLDYGCRMLQLPAARLSNTAYQELVESDRLDILQDEGLKERLRVTLGWHAFVAGQLGYFRDAFNQYRVVLGPYHRYVVDVQDGGVDCTIALGALSQDLRARQVLSVVYRDQQRFLLYRDQEAAALRGERDYLACLLDKPDCPTRREERPS